MTKKELLKILNNNNVTDEECLNLIQRINDILDIYNEMDFGDLMSVNNFINHGMFSQTRLFEPRNIASELHEILTEVKTCLMDKNKAAFNSAEKAISSIDGIDKRVSSIKAINKNNEIKRKSGHSVKSIFIFVIFVVSACAIVFAVLDNFEIMKWGGMASGWCGILDCFNGVAFFIYEFFDDKKAKYAFAESDSALAACNEELKRVSVNIKKINVNISENTGTLIVNQEYHYHD